MNSSTSWQRDRVRGKGGGGELGVFDLSGK